jgi:hypothetical protein
MPRRFRNQRVPVMGPSAVRAFLDRPLQNFDYLKDAPRDELLAHAHAAGMRFASDPWQHQLACFAIGMQVRRFLFFLKMGGGKSKIILDLLRYRKRRGELLKGIVLAPEELHVASWEDQIREHAPDLKYHLLMGDKADRFDAINKKADLFIMNYRGLLTFMAERRRITSKTDVSREAYQINPDLASEFACLFSFVAIDELHRTVDVDSTYYQAFRWMSLAANDCYGLTGTSFGRTPEPLWGQFNLIDLGETLGETPGMFRHTFFTGKRHHFKGIEWTFNKRTTRTLHAMIKHRSITYDVTEYRDMPMKLLIRVPVRLRGEGEAYYQRIIDGIIEARGDYSSLGNIFVRMRQCASGFLSLRADDKSRIDVRFADNPKMEALRDFLLARPDEKILVFHEYTHSGRFIEDMLRDVKIGFASVRGETDDVAGEYQRFLTDPKARIFVLNNSIGSEAINPQYVCRRAIFYESPVDPKKREQAEMRVWRPGQQWTVFIHDLLVLGTIEEKVQRYNREGRDLLKAVMTGNESLIAEDANE